MTGIEQLQAELGERHSPKTHETYTLMAREFFRVAGDKPDYTRQEILSYFDTQIKANKSQATLDLAWYVVKAICRAKSIEFPCKDDPKRLILKARKSAPRREVRMEDEDIEVSGPTPSLAEIARVIMHVRANGSVKAKAFLALSTIYAMRAIEISTVDRKEDIKGDRIFVRTAKGGEQRWQRIPEEVSPYIKGYSYPRQDEQAVWYCFKKMRTEAGVPRAPVTPHGIRRWLDTFFTTQPNVNIYAWAKFARWAEKRSDMVGRYSHPSAQQLDRIVFGLHPLLPLWRGEAKLGV